MKRIIVIGSGNVAESLVRALSREGNPPAQVFARDIRKAARVAAICGCAYTNKPAELAKADVYIVAVADKAVRQVTAALNFGGAVVAHTAASLGLDVFPENVKKRAVLYPLQTFSKGRAVDFRSVPVLIESDDPQSLAAVSEVAHTLSDNVREVGVEQRRMIHVAAVFACNFTNYMYTIGEELAADSGLDFSILKPLILETAHKALDAPSPRNVQTGPAIRNDFLTRSKHIELLEQKPDIQNMYINISKNIWETSKKTSR